MIINQPVNNHDDMHKVTDNILRDAGMTIKDSGGKVTFAGKDPSKREEVEAGVPMRRLCLPEEAAHFVATLIDGKGTFQTSQFFAIDGGWSFM